MPGKKPKMPFEMMGGPMPMAPKGKKAVSKKKKKKRGGKKPPMPY